jgi:hypothetical protein
VRQDDDDAVELRNRQINTDQFKSQRESNETRAYQIQKKTLLPSQS